MEYARQSFGSGRGRKKRVGDQVRGWLVKIYAGEDDDNDDLPDELILNDPELAKRAFTLMEATGWRLPLDVLFKQDDAVMMDLLALASEAAKIRRYFDKRRNRLDNG